MKNTLGVYNQNQVFKSTMDYPSLQIYHYLRLQIYRGFTSLQIYRGLLNPSNLP